MLKQVYSFIKNNNLINKGDHIVLAVSGGMDSVVMLDILYSISKEYGFSLSIFHLHHMIRKDSANEDAKFVKGLGEKYNIETIIEKVNIPKIAKEKGISDEMAGRTVRYEFFEKLAKEKSAKVATAHHLDDHIESIFLNIVRGTSIEGLTGIDIKREHIIRPLRCVYRENIENYVKNHKLDYCIDETNEDILYRRNFVRHEILLRIKAAFDIDFKKNLNRLSMLAIDDCEYFKIEVDKLIHDYAKITKDEIAFPIHKLQKLHKALTSRVIRSMIEKISGSKTDIEKNHIVAILALINKTSGKRIHLPRNLEAKRQFDDIIISNRIVNTAEKNECIAIEFGTNKDYDLGKQKVNVEFCSIKEFHKYKLESSRDILFMDADIIERKNELCFRKRRQGDYIHLEKRKITKSLKKYYIENKVSQKERDELWLLCENKRVIWIIGKEKSNPYALNKDTKQCIMIWVERGKYGQGN